MWMTAFGRHDSNYCLKVEQCGDDANCLLCGVNLKESAEKQFILAVNERVQTSE